MPTSPASQERFAEEIRRIYAEAETIILERIAKRLERGIDDEGWAEKKLQEIRNMRAQIEVELQRVQRADAQVADAVKAAYEAGSHDAVVDLEKLEQAEAVIATFNESNQRAVEVLVLQTLDNLQSTHLRILRAVEDIYRSVIAEVSAQVLTGTQTRREAAQVALNRFADAGITGFQDRSGRVWDLASYAEMAVRSATGQAAVQGHIDRLQANGRDLVIVSDSPEECPICRPWEGKILSISGNNPEYPSVAEARAAGLFHPNCTHSLGAYIPGLTRPMKGTRNPMGYEERHRQRYNERQIRKWKRREAVAITDMERLKARRKVREWQARQREFVQEHDRMRNYARESITRAR